MNWDDELRTMWLAKMLDILDILGESLPPGALARVQPTLDVIGC